MAWSSGRPSEGRRYYRFPITFTPDRQYRRSRCRRCSHLVDYKQRIMVEKVNGWLGLYPRLLQTQMGGLEFCDRGTGSRLVCALQCFSR